MVDLLVRSLWEADFKQKSRHAVKRDGSLPNMAACSARQVT
jgi:hypothetical protein